jgi:2-aminoadipate transaminase
MTRLSTYSRLGWITALVEVIQKLAPAKQGTDLHTSIFAQMVIYEVVRGGFWDRHVRFIRSVYHERRDPMLTVVEKYFPHGVHWANSQIQ